MIASETALGATDWLDDSVQRKQSLADRLGLMGLILFVKTLLHPVERPFDDLGPGGSSDEGEVNKANHWDDPALWILIMMH
jgi:hypothetical protein